MTDGEVLEFLKVVGGGFGGSEVHSEDLGGFGFDDSGLGEDGEDGDVLAGVGFVGVGHPVEGDFVE